MYRAIQEKIKEQINTYKANSRIISDYEKEQETFKEYNGRQVLELLQNADDEKSSEVFIKLDTKKQILEISNKGVDCKPFSVKGIESLMIANLSPKKENKIKKNYIGNKGLGFRSIVNWSEQITILTNNTQIDFSYEIAKEVYRQYTQKDISKIAFLSLPQVTKNKSNDWTTSIIVKYKDKFLSDMQKQLENINDEVLLFVNNIEKLTIDIDNNHKKTIERIKENNQIYLNDTLWTIFEYNADTLLPKEDENDEIEHFDLKIAVKENFNEEDKYLLYSFFPTEINIDFPFIIHGTFELDSSRNNIIISEKNRYILDKLVDFIVDTAKEFIKNEVNYRVLEFLTHNYSNERLNKLEFYDKIDEKIEELAIFPCLDNTYKRKDEVVFISDKFSEFIENNNFQEFFPNMLISSKNSFIDLDNYYISNNIDLSLIDRVSKKIDDIDVRVEFIYLIYNSFNNKNYSFEILIDENNQVIKKDEEVYTPVSKDYKFDIPKFINITFINNTLYNKLLQKFDITSNEKSRYLQRKLKRITNIQSYEPAQVLQKIITSTNKIIENEDDKKKFIKNMVLSLYKNFKFIGEKTKIPENTKIQILNKNQEIKNAKDLFLSKSYPSGGLTEFLFENIFEDSQFLIDKDFFDFQDEEMEEVERFFLWLGVNKYTKFEKIKYDYKYEEFIFTKINKPTNYKDPSFELDKIANLEKIIKCFKDKKEYEKLIIWFLVDDKIQYELNDKKTLDYFYRTIQYLYNAPSYILYQLSTTFNDYLITNEKLSSLVNDIYIDYEYKIFKKYNIKKANIESLLLKLGAVEKFEEISIGRIREILKSLEVKSPNGKQTQTIYKAVRNHKENLNDKTIRLCAKKNNELKYYSQDKIYYASNMKLPKKVLQNIPIINIPPRLGKVVEFFGIKDTKEIEISIDSYEENNTLTNEFRNFLSQIEQFIFVNRFDELKDEKSKKTELSKFKNSQIILCNEIVYQIDNKKFELDYNDYIKEGNKYYIKVENKNFNDIRKTSDFEDTFSDIIGSIFNIVDVEKYERLISDEIDKTENIINKKFGYEALEEVREYLNIADDFSTFWRTIYKLKNKIFNDKNKEIERIKQELNITTNLNNLDYKNLSSDDSCKVLQQLFAGINITIEDFNQETLYMKIDFTNYHQKNLENCFNDNYNKFEKILYQWCLDNDKKEDFIDLKGKYENANKTAKNILFMNYQNTVSNFVKDNFDFTLDDNQTIIDYNKIYDENISKIEIEELNNYEKSLLYFKDGFEKLQKKLQKIKKQNTEQQTQNKDDTTPRLCNDTTIDSIELFDKKKKSSYGLTYNPKKEKQKKKRGNTAEKCVYNYLAKEYGTDNVKWFAKESDSGHYDIRYRNHNNKWIYVEVKIFSNNMFYISRLEKDFADKKQENYEIFLIELSDNEICKNSYIRKIIEYKELKELKFIPNKYEVYYEIKVMI